MNKKSVIFLTLSETLKLCQILRESNLLVECLYALNKQKRKN